MDGYASVKVVNRRKVPYEAMFNGQTICFKPGQSRHFPPNVAHCIVADSVLKIDLASGVPSVFALAIEPEDSQEPVKPLKGSLAVKNDVEILDRTNDHQLTETEPKILSADGAEEMGIGKAEKTTTPLPEGNPLPPAEEMKTLSFHNAVSSTPRGAVAGNGVRLKQ
ncbi:MAG: hypothetical protein K0S79_97 [Nitrospira sp.]|jgi:hypothetical protein|nr:hypothetical protein [Nitrospira sp.]